MSALHKAMNFDPYLILQKQAPHPTRISGQNDKWKTIYLKSVQGHETEKKMAL